MPFAMQGHDTLIPGIEFHIRRLYQPFDNLLYLSRDYRVHDSHIPYVGLRVGQILIAGWLEPSREGEDRPDLFAVIAGVGEGWVRLAKTFRVALPEGHLIVRPRQHRFGRTSND